MDIFSVIAMVGGLTFFLFGMHVMSNSLEKMAGGKLELKLKQMTSNPFVSMLMGMIITIAMQSSSATTVMLVGLVSSGILEFSQTLYVIFGANIGTTLTGWILSLSGIQSENIFISMLKPVNFSPILAFAGILMLMLSKNDRKKSIGTVFVGFAILMYGMNMMSDAVSPLADSPAFTAMLTEFQNPILGVLVGLVFTAIIQSSAASIGILVALSRTGALTYAITIPMIMGLNIGTCATSLISCIGTDVKAKRVAVVHTSIKVIGMLICLPLFMLGEWIFNLPTDLSVTPATIAAIHTVYNILITVILMPFTKYLVKLTGFIVKDKNEKTAQQDEFIPIYSPDERLLRSPSVAVAECDACTIRMSQTAYDTLIATMAILFEMDERTAQWISLQETELDTYEDQLGTYLVRLSPESLSLADSRKISKMLHTIGDFERMGDHAVNLLKVAQEIADKKLTFSAEAYREMQILTDALIEILTLSSEAYRTDDLTLANRVEPLEQVIDRLTSQIRSNHVHRLQKGTCTIEMGFILSDILNNYERISDHCSNVAVAIIEASHDSFDTHRYLNSIKYGNDDFDAVYEEFDNKYTL